LNAGLQKPDFEVRCERMTAWSPKQILVLLLAALVTAGLGFAAVQANGMSVKMAMMSDDGITAPPNNSMAMMPDVGGNGDCDACAGGASDHGNQMPCSPVCVSPALAVLPQLQALAAILRTPQMPVSRLALLHGRNSLPDPSPPKPSDLV
jgi:hypothetical protein